MAARAPSPSRTATPASCNISSPQSRRWPALGDWPIWVILLLALGVVLRVREYLLVRSLWLDESLLALELIEKTPRQLLGPLGFNQGAPAGFLLGQKAMGELVGYSELTLRLLPLIFGVLALFVFVPLARRTVADGALPAALMLVVAADGLVYYASEVKQYSVDVFVAVCLLAAAAPLVRSAPVRRSVVLLALAATPLILLSHAGVLVAAGCAVVIVATAVVARRRDRVRRVVPIAAVWAIACLVVVLAAPNYDELRAAQARGSDAFVGQADGVSDPSWIVTFGGSVAVDLGLPGGGSLTLVAKILGALAVVGFASLLRRDPAAAALLGAPIVIAIAVSALELYPVYPRTLLFLVPVAALLIGEGVLTVTSFIGSRHRRIALAAATLLVVALPAAKAAARFVDRPVGQELKPALAYVRDHWRPGDVLYLSWGDQYTYLYYLRCGCFELNTPAGPPLPRGVVPLQGKEDQDYAAFRSITPSLIVSRHSFWDVEGRLGDIDRLRGRGRVWILSAHMYPGDGRSYREKLLPRRLDDLGRRLDTYPGRGGRAYLYDFRRG